MSLKVILPGAVFVVDTLDETREIFEYIRETYEPDLKVREA